MWDGQTAEQAQRIIVYGRGVEGQKGKTKRKDDIRTERDRHYKTPRTHWLVRCPCGDKVGKQTEHIMVTITDRMVQ